MKSPFPRLSPLLVLSALIVCSCLPLLHAAEDLAAPNATGDTTGDATGDAASDATSEAGERQLLQMPEGASPSEIRVEEMPMLGEGRLPRLLNRFYELGQGGRETWRSISSLRTIGTLNIDGEEYALDGLQKKPGLIKLEIGSAGRVLVLGYDGETAWQKLPEAEEVEPMVAERQRRFAHSAVFGNYLLFPFAEGKQIEFIDTVPMEGSICHHLRVYLPYDYVVDYFIDYRSFNILKLVSRDLLTDDEVMVTYHDFDTVAGVDMAKTVKNYENGVLKSVLEVDEFRANTGVMSWMFERP